MLAVESIPFVRIGILTDVTAHLRAMVPARSLGKFPHTCKLDFEREHPSPTSHCCADEAGDNYLDEFRVRPAAQSQLRRGAKRRRDPVVVVPDSARSSTSSDELTVVGSQPSKGGLSLRSGGWHDPGMIGQITGDEDDPATVSDPGDAAPGLEDSCITALVIAWYKHDPARVGELAMVPSGGRVVLGRGANDLEPRMRFFRARPGRLEPTPPLAAPALSRRQLELTVSGEKTSVRRVGKCPLRVNGVEQDSAVIAPGTTLAFGQELVLLCVFRPACPGPLLHWPAAETPVFGEADRFGIVGESPAIWQLRDDLAFAAKSGQHVLLLGESGTGKELAAHAIHQLSSRASQTFVARNAATLPAGLMDAEVFGNVRNYPNPGMAERPGLVGQADRGFLFLDETAELPLELQTHLLRVLDKRGEYQRLGETGMRRSDFRVIAATNRAPDELRPDLLARFPVRIELPPLRERREDIGPVVRHIALKAVEADAELKGRFCELAADGKTLLKMDSRLVDWMLRGESPANVRDLEARLWKAMATSKGAAIGYTDELEVLARASVPPQPDDTAQANSRPRNREPTLVEIREALQLAQGNVARAAQGLGLSSRYALYRILRKHSVESIDGVN